MKTGLATILCVVACLGTGSTLASTFSNTPQDCRGSMLLVRAYASGLAFGSAHFSTYGCDDLPLLSANIAEDLDSLLVYESTSEYVLCRTAGVVNGTMAVLDALSQTCTDCCALGEVVGKLQAVANCWMLAALDGLGDPERLFYPPSTACTQGFSSCCDLAFTTTYDAQCPYAEPFVVSKPTSDFWCMPGPFCGGFAGISCPPGYSECIDDPRDSCDPTRGGADCSGICVH